MKKEKRMAGHPHHKGGGMPYFDREHWQKPYAECEVADGKYTSEFGAPEELHEQVSKLAQYTRKHKMKY